MFQHTATRRWLHATPRWPCAWRRFQHTATRRWLLAHYLNMYQFDSVSTHSHPKVAAAQYPELNRLFGVSTHSHPKVAALKSGKPQLNLKFQHTATRRWLPAVWPTISAGRSFQHTATRRWLRGQGFRHSDDKLVSTHSHPKVAANPAGRPPWTAAVSTHSHPKVAARKSMHR